MRIRQYGCSTQGEHRGAATHQRRALEHGGQLRREVLPPDQVAQLRQRSQPGPVRGLEAAVEVNLAEELDCVLLCGAENVTLRVLGF